MYILSVFSSSKCSLFHNSNIWFLYYSHFIYRCAKIKKKFRRQKVNRLGLKPFFYQGTFLHVSIKCKLLSFLITSVILFKYFAVEMTRILSQNYHNTKPKYNWQHKELHNLYKWMNVKVKVSRYRPGVAQRVGKAIALPFVDRVTRSGWVVSSTPRPHFTPRERRGNHFTGGWVDPRLGLDGRKISSPPGFDPGRSSP